ncbi:putative hydrogenase maturation protein HupD [Mycobacterium xenopi 4042]|uniref:Putative hydrogenase maturation protein HupD n=1 Tax=Mycobacterium xenopi 4042 TaxID=1299334 RepID=X7Z557_MYCXE|nr:putative hydrogenase maturation protein HupD [Mycobacterium xenopi 4042]
MTMSARSARILVAGIGNIFLGDDGFGPEVLRQLPGRLASESVRVSDYGIGACIWPTTCSKNGTPWSWSTRCPTVVARGRCTSSRPTTAGWRPRLRSTRTRWTPRRCSRAFAPLAGGPEDYRGGV